MTSSVLVTGAAGFIGSHLAASLVRGGSQVVACDALSADLCDPRLKRDRVTRLLAPLGVPFEVIDLADPVAVRALFARSRFTRVVHLAAQAGVRHSIDAPEAFVHSNLVAFANVLEACRHSAVEHLVYASSSSIYGARQGVPFRESDRTDQPGSFYAATKRANELMAYSYAHLYRLRCTALRFFTVYGPWGRPDMAYFSFAQRIRRGEPITLFGDGTMRRDFTYIDDIVEGVKRVALAPCASADPEAPHATFNIGNHEPAEVLELVRQLEGAFERRAVLRFEPIPGSEVPVTFADVSRLRDWTGFAPSTPLAAGIRRFARWLEEWDPLPA